jgi:hypothetical protein
MLIFSVRGISGSAPLALRQQPDRNDTLRAAGTLFQSNTIPAYGNRTGT